MVRAASEEKDAGFLRFVEGSGEYAGELQTALVTYRNGRGVEVDLVATVHMAERAYYENLNAYFSHRDTVLYELVADESVRPDGTGVGRGSGIIGLLQTSMTRLLGLSYQLDVINYARPNFVHADLEPAELQALMDAKGESLLSAFLALILSDAQARDSLPTGPGGDTLDLSLTDIIKLFSLPNRQTALKYLLGQTLAVSEGSLSALTGSGFTLLDDRNEAALATLRVSLDETAVRKLSIFYGSAHMPGLELGLTQMGFVPVSRTWLTAWRTE
ncbi:MAG: hypothetical protein KDI29_08500 [Pseudomonadales bacterium]|nr:hypothetical protein [Pseudomonadales bacterium]